MGAGELGRKFDPALDLFVDRLLLTWFAGVSELGIGQDAAHGIEQLRLLDGERAE